MLFPAYFSVFYNILFTVYTCYAYVYVKLAQKIHTLCCYSKHNLRNEHWDNKQNFCVCRPFSVWHGPQIFKSKIPASKR